MEAILEGLLKSDIVVGEEQRRIWVDLVEVDGNLERVGDAATSVWVLYDGERVLVACVERLVCWRGADAAADVWDIRDLDPNGAKW